MATFHIVQSEPGLWTIGTGSVEDGTWVPYEDIDNYQTAKQECAYMNGAPRPIEGANEAIRATNVQLVLTRIAEALERIADSLEGGGQRDDLAESAAIWGTEL